MVKKASCGFAIYTYDQQLIEENARESFGPDYGDPDDRAEVLKRGLVDKDGEITQKGWDLLSDDIDKLEDNSLRWLRENFRGAQDEGHDSRGDLVGSLRYDADDPEQVAVVELGEEERIDMVDSSYGGLADSVWDGTSEFSTVLGGHITFFDVQHG